MLKTVFNKAPMSTDCADHEMKNAPEERKDGLVVTGRTSSSAFMLKTPKKSSEAAGKMTPLSKRTHREVFDDFESIYRIIKKRRRAANAPNMAQ